MKLTVLKMLVDVLKKKEFGGYLFKHESINLKFNRNMSKLSSHMQSVM